MREIGVLGGMFDPIHAGHIRAAQAALKAGAERVLLCPCQMPAHRAQAIAPAGDRLQLCEMAARDHPGMEACGADLREGPCYTVDTVDILQARYPGARICWIIGADKLPTLNKWYGAERLLAACDFWVCPRPGYDAHLPVPGARLRVLDVPPVAASSAEVVQRLRAYDDAAGLISRAEAQYIAENGLYQPDYEALLKARGMPEKRLLHTLGVRRTAAALAGLHGARMQAAGVAAMLHDIAKPLSLPEMQKKAQEYDLRLPKDIYADENLLHGPVAAAIAEHELGILDREILSAIACHTIGKPDMTVLEQVIYLADAIEPTRRDYPGLAQIRALAQTDLSAAVLLSMQRTREYVLSQGHAFCPQTELAMQSLAAKEEIK